MKFFETDLEKKKKPFGTIVLWFILVLQCSSKNQVPYFILDKVATDSNLILLLVEKYIQFFSNLSRAVASLTVPGGHEFHLPHSLLKFRSSFKKISQFILIFFLILALGVGDLPTQKDHSGRPVIYNKIWDYYSPHT